MDELDKEKPRHYTYEKTPKTKAVSRQETERLLADFLAKGNQINKIGIIEEEDRRKKNLDVIKAEDPQNYIRTIIKKRGL